MILSRYERNDNLRVINYIRELTHLRFSENGNLDAYLNSVDRLVRLICGAAGEETLPDTLKVGFIYAGLPDSMLDWISGRTSIESNRIDNVLVDLRKYVDFKREFSTQKVTLDPSGAFFAEKKPSKLFTKPGQFRPKPKRKRFCTTCKADTHDTNYHDRWIQKKGPATHAVAPYNDEAYVVSVPESALLADHSISN
jgi:hypothetical protein